MLIHFRRSALPAHYPSDSVDSHSNQGGRDDFRTASLWHRSPEIDREWTAFSWAHTFERLWFSVMDPKYETHLLEDAAAEEAKEARRAEALQNEEQRLAASGAVGQRRSRRRGLRGGGERQLLGEPGEAGGGELEGKWEKGNEIVGNGKRGNEKVGYGRRGSDERGDRVNA